MQPRKSIDLFGSPDMLLHNLYLALVAVLKAASRFDHSEKIYGVNVGSWLIIEPWMMPEEWIKMGGEICDPNKCWTCISSESALVESSPHTADAKFAAHWATWFTKADVDRFVDLGINAVRIPIGYWIIDALVDRTTEFYPRGGMKYLVQGLGWLKDAGIRVVLDHHGLPGAASINQVFTGRCTSEPNFYNPYNYRRALVWTATMTALSHLHPNFETVFAIEAANEPVPDANLTPGYGDFQVAFVQTVRLMELLLGVYSVEECVARFGRNAADLRRVVADLQGAVYGHASLNLTTTLSAFAVGDDGNLLSSEATAAVAEALPIILDVALGLGLHDLKSWSAYKGRGAPLTTNFMDMTWQYYGTPANPADAAMGPQTYDNHLYLCFGDAKTADPVTYINDICNLPRVDAAWDNRNAPLWFGEWSLGTQFNATPEFMRDFADAQKLQFTTGGGWFFWNFKIEESEAAKERVNQWSYYKGVELGWLTKDPSHINNPDVCEKYKNLASQAPKHRIHL